MGYLGYDIGLKCNRITLLVYSKIIPFVNEFEWKVSFKTAVEMNVYTQFAYLRIMTHAYTTPADTL